MNRMDNGVTKWTALIALFNCRKIFEMSLVFKRMTARILCYLLFRGLGFNKPYTANVSMASKK